MNEVDFIRLLAAAAASNAREEKFAETRVIDSPSLHFLQLIEQFTVEEKFREIVETVAFIRNRSSQQARHVKTKITGLIANRYWYARINQNAMAEWMRKHPKWDEELISAMGSSPESFEHCVKRMLAEQQDVQDTQKDVRSHRER